MPKFAVYYIPQAESDFYRLGTSIVGYDVRAQCLTEMPIVLRDRLGGYNQSWVQRARPYGFHLTIGDAIDFDLERISDIEREISELLRCFKQEESPFVLFRCEKDFVTFWGNQKEIVVLRYNANERLKFLQALIVARVNPLGFSSGYLQRYLENPSRYTDRPDQVQRIRKFYAPFVLDQYTPHFTLMNPYGGSDQPGLSLALHKIFKDVWAIPLESICLLVQMQDDGMWKIHKEFSLSP